MRIVPVPCLSDNYAYLVIAGDGRAAVVDVSEAAPVREALKREGATLGAIWSTHHHPDHVGGNTELAASGVEVVGHKSDRGRIPGQTKEVDTGDVVRVGDVSARCIHIPGHTLGALAYYVEVGGERAVFTGDTLFCAGCGRLFEGTPAQMRGSLYSLLELPLDTRVYCGHEYSESNLRFAEHVEPDNQDVVRALERATEKRARKEPTMGTTLAEERATNPFLRDGSATIRRTLGIGANADAIEAFAAIRKAKDSFR